MAVPIPQPPNAGVQIVNADGRATPLFLKLLGELCQTTGAALDARVAALEGQVATLNGDITTANAAIAATNAVVAGHTSHLAALPTSRLTGSAAYNPPNILALGTATTTVAVAGAALGMAAEASFSLDLLGLTVTAYVDSANSVTVVLFNPTALAIDVGNGTLKAFVWTP